MAEIVKASLLHMKSAMKRNVPVKTNENTILMLQWLKPFKTYVNLTWPPFHFLVDCEWSEWNLGTCSATCGKGNREKFRSKIVEEINGGNCSGDSEATEDCNEKDCPSKSKLLALAFI